MHARRQAETLKKKSAVERAGQLAAFAFRMLVAGRRREMSRCAFGYGYTLRTSVKPRIGVSTTVPRAESDEGMMWRAGECPIRIKGFGEGTHDRSLLSGDKARLEALQQQTCSKHAAALLEPCRQFHPTPGVRGFQSRDSKTRNWRCGSSSTHAHWRQSCARPWLPEGVSLAVIASML